MTFPLTGLRVIEMATFIAAPTCARVLSDWGADVIKVESPKGDPMHKMGAMIDLPVAEGFNPGFDMMNSNKRSLIIDYTKPEGAEILLSLIESADIFITNVREASLKKYKFDYESLKDRYPGLIYGHITGYGDEGADAGAPGFDFTAYYSRSGISGTLYEKGTAPLVAVPGFGDFQAGMYLAAGLLAAYIKKADSGKGDRVTTSLFHTGLYNMSYMIASAQFGNSYPKSRYENQNPLQCTYKTKDERWLQIAFAVYELGYKRFYKAISRTDLLEDRRFTDFEFVKQNTQYIIRIIEEEIQRKTLEEWMNIFREGDIPCDKLSIWEETVEDKQAWDNGYFENLAYPHGEVALVNTPIKFRNAEIKRIGYGPVPGDNTRDILSEINIEDDTIDHLIKNKIIR